MDTYALAPWSLQGSGYIMVFRLGPEFVSRHGFVPRDLKGAYQGGPGIVMYVDYTASPVGPYRELLFIPGRFDFSGKKYFSITKIYVSSPASVEGGRQNWGIPKELAAFHVTSEQEGKFQVRVGMGEKTFADLLFRSPRVGLPVTTKLIPSALRTLAHIHDGRTMITRIQSHGAVSTACLLSARIDESFFPPVFRQARGCILSVPHFSMVFPKCLRP